MAKFFIAIFLIFMVLPAAVAGRGANVVIDNSTDVAITIYSLDATCMNFTENINAKTVESISALRVYLEASNSFPLCTAATSGSGQLGIMQGANYLGSVDYSISSTSNTQASVSLLSTLNYNLRAYSINLKGRFGSGQDLIVIRITPAEHGQYKNWMWQLRAALKNKRLTEVIFPGTHDSFTYDLNSISVCNSDSGATQAAALAPGFAKAQDLDFYTQLTRGIRYFDIRLCRQDGTNYTTHSLISRTSFEEQTANLKQFIESNPYEIIIFDLQHVYGYDENNFKAFLGYIKTNFGDHLINASQVKITDNLATIWGINYSCPRVPHNLLVILPDAAFSSNILSNPNYNFAWPRGIISSPWPNTFDVASVIQKNNAYLSSRSHSLLFVNQLIPTPPSDTSWYASLDHSSETLDYQTITYLPEIYSWLNSNISNGLNIYIRDWSNGYDGAIFAIRANSK